MFVLSLLQIALRKTIYSLDCNCTLNAGAVEYVHCMRAEEFWCISVQCRKSRVVKINEMSFVSCAQL
jgi:hypothetical protein